MRKIILVMFMTLTLVLTGCQNTIKDPKIIIEVEGYEEKIELELYSDIAPITVQNFTKLVQDKSYDGTVFHRIIKGFMIQGGAVNKDLTPIKGEFSSNGFENTLKHKRGVISMARTNIKDSATSQFFIVHEDSSHLDGDYAAFGMMTSGFQTLDLIAKTPTIFGDSPVNEVKIKTIRIKK